jgi:acyl-CoA thioester hydrolase
MYERTLFASWGDMDFNGHMRNTAYLDKAADVRLMFFAAHGLAALQGSPRTADFKELPGSLR